MDTCWVALCILSSCCLLLYAYTKRVADEQECKTFQRTYMAVFVLAVGAKWLHGSYIYALYQDYGIISDQHNFFLIAGLISSTLFGTVIASLSDKYGRKFLCIVYAVMYISFCATKHFANFYVLLIGHISGGIAMTILFSAFESWVVCEHHKRGYSEESLRELFYQTTMSSSLVAASANHVAKITANHYGCVAPFDAAAGILVIMVTFVWFLWKENYGDSSMDVSSSFSFAFSIIKRDRQCLLLGLVQALTEGAVCAFVIKWQPAVTLQTESNIGFPSVTSDSLVFSCFMVAVMTGSLLFKVLVTLAPIASFMRYTLLFAAAAMVFPVAFAEDNTLVLVSFCFFNVCVGIFWPSLCTMRSHYIPDSVRSTVMTIFRIPLNLVMILISLHNINLKVIFSSCFVLLVMATAAQHMLFIATQVESSTPVSSKVKSANGAMSL